MKGALVRNVKDEGKSRFAPNGDYECSVESSLRRATKKVQTFKVNAKLIMKTEPKLRLVTRNEAGWRSPERDSETYSQAP